jgi:DNA-binding MarR family transcriptional regulator
VSTDPDTLELANRLRPALLKLGRLLRREARALGITGGQSTLLALIARDPDVGARELAAREGVSAPVITRYLDRMEAAGLVRRERSPSDARRLRVTLTPDGTRALRSIRSRRTAFLAERLGRLSPEERAALAAAVGPLLALVEEDGPEPPSA